MACVRSRVQIPSGPQKIIILSGSVPEWLKGAVSKTVILVRVSEVRILPLPQRPFSMFNFFKKDKKSKEPKNLKEIFNYIKELEENIENISQGLQNVKEMAILSLQKVGIVRYNPFEDSGGDQSFSIAILDANNNGFVFTSIYGREGNRVFAKPIRGGKSSYPFSEEEKKAIEQAINSENPKP